MRALLMLLSLLLTLPSAQADEIRIGTWNIANLHHETNVGLRRNSKPRDEEDYDRLRHFAESLELHIVGLQEIGSPAALARVFPSEKYHLVMSERYAEGDELRPADERDIYNAFAVRRDAFDTLPEIATLHALSLINLSVSTSGEARDRPTRAGMVLTLPLGSRTVKILNVHLKSFCHEGSLNPVFDVSRSSGRPLSSRYDCRTLAAQALLLESWIEQQIQLGYSIMVIGDFNRRFNRFDHRPGVEDHFWQMIDDGQPNDLSLRRGPTDKNEACWPAPHHLFRSEHIDFIIFDSTLDDVVDLASIRKVPLPFADDPKYEGKEGERLSDHCPVVGVINVN